MLRAQGEGQVWGGQQALGHAARKSRPQHQRLESTFSTGLLSTSPTHGRGSVSELGPRSEGFCRVTCQKRAGGLSGNSGGLSAGGEYWEDTRVKKRLSKNADLGRPSNRRQQASLSSLVDWGGSERGFHWPLRVSSGWPDAPRKA